MIEKTGRNDPCPCGSGKKYKQCCMLKKNDKPAKRVFKAVWVNQPVQQQEPVNLIERTFGSAIASASDKPPQPFQINKETPPKTHQDEKSE